MKVKKQQWTMRLAAVYTVALLVLQMLWFLSGIPVFAENKEEPSLTVRIPVKQTVIVTAGNMETNEEKKQAETSAASARAVYVLTTKNGAPLPEGAQDGRSTLVCTGNSDQEGFDIEYTSPGEYVYVLKLESVSKEQTTAEGPDIKSQPEVGQELVIRVYVKEDENQLIPKVLAYTGGDGVKTDLSFIHSWSEAYVPKPELPGVGGIGVSWFYAVGGLLIAFGSIQYIRRGVCRR